MKQHGFTPVDSDECFEFIRGDRSMVVVRIGDRNNSTAVDESHFSDRGMRLYSETRSISRPNHEVEDYRITFYRKLTHQ
ncbi:hypothetical protein ECANGB1_450 [Enterospora canceri]|uniref:Uncharacterized protein n=1 Tax=Enterospora canceri TaxID=1081671 RepID=A0A1Y1S7Y1_9MICR|nr:hypothetical protein ECANGB1_450 [Enterospora canceri]